MAEQRKQKKDVILVGDLNISHTKIDKFWSDRVLFVNDIREECVAMDASKLPKWKVELASAWPKIEAALATKKVVPAKTTNPLTNQKYEKYRMTVQVDGRQLYLGSHESSPGCCEYSYGFDSWHYTCAETDEQILAEEDNVVCLSVMAELMSKIAGVQWDEQTQRAIAETAADTSRAQPPRRWLNAVIDEDGMVDAFRHFYPSAEGRYTCWNQFTNRRYFNEGARIDFTLVDKSLLQYVQRGNVDSLRCCSSEHDPNSESAALCVATANGGFQAVSFQGGGIIESSQDALDTQFGIPHTGMIYTPPSFSDHTAISLLLNDECISRQLKLDEHDSATRKTQPHKSQKSISSFFTASSSTDTPKQTSATKKPFAPTSVKRKGIQNFFSTKKANIGG
jgi:hypothetical protein